MKSVNVSREMIITSYILILLVLFNRLYVCYICIYIYTCVCRGSAARLYPMPGLTRLTFYVYINHNKNLWHFLKSIYVIKQSTIYIYLCTLFTYMYSTSYVL